MVGITRSKVIISIPSYLHISKMHCVEGVGDWLWASSGICRRGCHPCHDLIFFCTVRVVCSKSFNLLTLATWKGWNACGKSLLAMMKAFSLVQRLDWMNHGRPFTSSYPWIPVDQACCTWHVVKLWRMMFNNPPTTPGAKVGSRFSHAHHSKQVSLWGRVFRETRCWIG